MKTATNEKHVLLTERLIEHLEAGCAPWVRPWASTSAPSNASTRKAYRGANVVGLWMGQMVGGYTSAQWVTFAQALAMKGSVRKGEHGWPIVFYTVRTKAGAGKDGSDLRIPVLKSYTVFNLEQCDGLEGLAPAGTAKEPFARLADADAFIAAVHADVRHGGDRAFYQPSGDFIGLPNPDAFSAPEYYYATSLHEHAHWSGHEKRLARTFGKRFGDQAYGFEELVAELTSAYLCAELEIPGVLRHPEYLASWINILRADPKALLTAGSQASKAADYLAALAGRRATQDDVAEEEADVLPLAA